jgi:hypothetical protein
LDQSALSFPGFALTNHSAAQSIIPVLGVSPVRTYELVIKKLGRDIILVTDGEDSTLEITIAGDGVCNLFLSGTEGGATWAVNGFTLDDDDLYHHVCIVVDATEDPRRLVTYQDGVLLGTDSHPLDLQWAPSFYDRQPSKLLGWDNTAGGSCEMMVHDVELTPAEILQRSFYMRAVNAQE